MTNEYTEQDYRVRYVEYCMESGEDLSPEGFREYVEWVQRAMAESRVKVPAATSGDVAPPSTFHKIFQ